MLDEEPIVYQDFCHKLLENRHEMGMLKFTALSQFNATRNGLPVSSLTCSTTFYIELEQN
jgi:hypothetical protein